MLQQVFAIARNTFIESIRQPIFVVLLLVATLLLILNTALAAYTFEKDDKILIEMGFSTLLGAGLFLAAVTATGVLSAELENRTVLTVISKPVPRPVFILGKYLGVAAAVGIAYWSLSLIFLFTVRHGVMQTASDLFDGPVLAFAITAGLLALIVATLANYLYHWVFTSTFVLGFTGGMSLAYLLVLLIDREWQFQPLFTEFVKNDGITGQIALGLLMVFEAVLVLIAVAIAVSTRLGQLMNLVICAAVFGLGLVTSYLNYLAERAVHGRGSDDAGFATYLGYGLAKLFYVVVPNLQFFWPADALTLGHHFTLIYIASLTGYCLLFVVALLGLAVALFQTREVG